MNEIDKLHLLDFARCILETGSHSHSKSENITEASAVLIKVFVGKEFLQGFGIFDFNKPAREAIGTIMPKVANFIDSEAGRGTKGYNRVRLSLSLLSNLEALEGDPSDYSDQIKIGKHGLLVNENETALLLPDYALDRNLSVFQFLNLICQKAGLSFNAWRNPETEIYRFQADTLSE